MTLPRWLLQTAPAVTIRKSLTVWSLIPLTSTVLSDDSMIRISVPIRPPLAPRSTSAYLVLRSILVGVTRYIILAMLTEYPVLPSKRWMLPGGSLGWFFLLWEPADLVLGLLVRLVMWARMTSFSSSSVVQSWHSCCSSCSSVSPLSLSVVSTSWKWTVRLGGCKAGLVLVDDFAGWGVLGKEVLLVGLL